MSVSVSVCPSVYLFVYLSFFYPSVGAQVSRWLICLSLRVFVCPLSCASTHMCLFVCLSVDSVSVCLSVYRSFCKYWCRRRAPSFIGPAICRICSCSGLSSPYGKLVIVTWQHCVPPTHEKIFIEHNSTAKNLQYVHPRSRVTFDAQKAQCTFSPGIDLRNF